jgi:hypothetical protein
MGSIPWFSMTGAAVTLRYETIVSAVFQLGFLAWFFCRSQQARTGRQVTHQPPEVQARVFYSPAWIGPRRRFAPGPSGSPLGRSVSPRKPLGPYNKCLGRSQDGSAEQSHDSVI